MLPKRKPTSSGVGGGHEPFVARRIKRLRNTLKPKVLYRMTNNINMVCGVKEKKPTRKQDWLDPQVRSLVGSKSSADEVLLLRLFDAKATSKKRAIPLSDFTIGQLPPAFAGGLPAQDR